MEGMLLFIVMFTQRLSFRFFACYVSSVSHWNLRVGRGLRLSYLLLHLDEPLLLAKQGFEISVALHVILN